jgi:hypothetical protein
MRPGPSDRRHELSFRQSFVLCRECGQEVDTLSAWLDQPCAGREASPLARDVDVEGEDRFRN